MDLYVTFENNYSIYVQLLHFMSNGGYQRFRQSDGWVDRWMGGSIDGRMDGWMWIDGKKEERTDGWTVENVQADLSSVQSALFNEEYKIKKKFNRSRWSTKKPRPVVKEITIADDTETEDFLKHCRKKRESKQMIMLSCSD